MAQTCSYVMCSCKVTHVVQMSMLTCSTALLPSCMLLGQAGELGVQQPILLGHVTELVLCRMHPLLQEHALLPKVSNGCLLQALSAFSMLAVQKVLART